MKEEKNVAPISFDEKSINLREELEKYLYYWKWFILSVIISLTLVWLYVRYTHPVYSASISVLIKEDSKGNSSGLAGFNDLNLIMGGGSNVNNEIELFKSRSSFVKVVENLNLDVKYYSEGNILTSENYKSAPIIVTFINEEEKDVIQLNDFFVKKISNDQFQLLDINKKDLGNFYYNDTISKYNISIKPNVKRLSEEYKNDKEILVRKHSLIALASSYQSKLQVNNIKGTSVLKLTITDVVKNRAIDILNEIVSVYNNDDLEDRNQTFIHTADFINKRLEIIKNELTEVEKKAEKFKKENKLTNLSSEAELFLQGSTEYNKKVVEIETELSVLNFVEKSLNNNQNDFLPEIVAVSDSNVPELISNYNELVSKKKRLLKSSTERNPSVININNNISTIKNSILNSINNLNSSLLIRKKKLKKEENKFKGRIASVPAYENIFRGFERQQQIKENLYLYLLQKREETALALSATEKTTKIIDSAYGGYSPISPNKKILYLGGLVLGFLLPFSIIYLKNLFNNKLQTRKDIENLTSIPILGDVPRSNTDKKIVVSEQDRSSTAESFRLLRTNINFMLSKVEEKSKVIYITSTLSGEGKTFISINLASVLALTSKKVLLIGADIRKPKITDYLNVGEGKGLTHYLMDENLEVQDVIDEIEGSNFDMLHSGVIAPNPSELLMNGRFKNVIEYGKQNYDYVVVDTAPVSLVTDTLLLSDFADLFIYVSRVDYLDKRLLDVPKRLYDDRRLPNMAILLNDTNSEKGYGYGYGYGYGGYEQESKEKKWWQFYK